MYTNWKVLEKRDAQFSMDYIKMLHIEDEAVMAICYGYLTPLCKKLFVYSNTPQEISALLWLFNHPDLKLKLEYNNNITLYN